MTLGVVQTLCKLWTTAHTAPKVETFSFLKNKSSSHSTSKLCVSAGPEPSGPEPVLLRVLSICRPRVCPPLGEDPSITAQRQPRRPGVRGEDEPLLFCLNRATSRETFRDQVDTFFLPAQLFLDVKTSAVAVKIPKFSLLLNFTVKSSSDPYRKEFVKSCILTSRSPRRRSQNAFQQHQEESAGKFVNCKN